MQHTLTQPIPAATPHAHTERGAHILELKREYEAGQLASTVSPTEISDMLISALFEDARPANSLVH